uniref:Uncharacterized protein n=1 Tax=Faecalibaculum rodentium TaxID=1702221 RepID=A0A140DUW2_9FIRM|nr:hypothetical protein AALO17_13050 [Faecalibaculum rodentium]
MPTPVPCRQICHNAVTRLCLAECTASRQEYNEGVKKNSGAVTPLFP